MLNGFNEIILKGKELTTKNCHLSHAQIEAIKKGTKEKLDKIEKERGIAINKESITYVIDGLFSGSVGVRAKYKNGSVLFSVQID